MWPMPNGEDRRTGRWCVAVAAVLIVASIGLPLVGVRVFLGSDLLFLQAPWSEVAPADLRPTNPLVADTVDAVMPRRHQFVQRVRAGDLPTWLPHPSGGIPLFSQPVGGLASPFILTYLVTPAWYAPAAAKLAELLVAAGATYLFLRRLKLPRAAGAFGGMVYAFSGFQVVWTNWTQTWVAALIPAMFWSVEVAVRDRRGAPLAVTTAALVLGGFPAVAAYALAASGIYAVVRVLASRPPGADGALRAAASRLGRAASAVALGVGLAAFQVLPFVSRLGSLDLGYREQSAGFHVPVEGLLTAAVPNAFGSPVHGVGYGPLDGRIGFINYIELQSFVGVTALLLIGVAAVRWGRPRLPRGIATFLAAGAVACTLLIFVGGPPLGWLQSNPLTGPLFGINFIGRLSSLWGFLLACLAAVGLAALREPPVRPRRRSLVVVGVGAVAMALLVGRAWSLAGDAGRQSYLLEQAAVPVAVAVAAAAALVLGIRAGRQQVATVLLTVLLAVEILVLVGPLWARPPRDQFYPDTPAHRFLQANLGIDRLAAEHRTLYPGTTTFYGLRSVTAHAFQTPRWAALLRAADPLAFKSGTSQPPVRLPTFPHLRPEPAVATSPILDRLSARYFAAAPHLRVFGAEVPVSEPQRGQHVLLGPGETVLVPLPRTAVRAVVVTLSAPVPRAADPARLAVDVLDADGEVVASGRRRLFPADRPVVLGEISMLFAGERPGPFSVPVTQADRDGPGWARIQLDAAAGEVALAADDGGTPAVTLVAPREDGLRVVFADGTVLYERLRALPRVRWAGTAEVVPAAAARVAQLAAGVPAGTVVLSDPGPAGGGIPAPLSVVEDSGDRITVEVDAAADGYVVVADNIARTWTASVDGRHADLVDADHAVAAVHVPAGRHTVALRHAPPGWRAGLAVSAVALAVLAVLALAERQRRWRASPRSDVAAAPPVSVPPPRQEPGP